MSLLRTISHRLMRKKTIVGAKDESDQTKLSRCLTTTDLVALGVGSTLGAGVYVLTGSVARDKTGPSIVLSFLVAALASVMAGLCYAEFGSRVPKAGSAYVYSYVTVGELWAFVIGWNLILEYVIGTSSVARAWSENVDTLIGGRFRQFSLTYLKMDVQGFAEYPDFFACAIILILTVILCVGVKESARFSKLFTLINVAVILFVIIAGSTTADLKNWSLTKEDIKSFVCTEINKTNTINTSFESTNTGSTDFACSNKTVDRYGKGGFLPYGFSGMMSGAATCFFGFVGFDIIATTGEEVLNPQQSIPRSIVLSLLIVFCAYVGISVVLTLMIPYYMLDVGAPLPRAFDAVGWKWSVYPLAIGATCALSSSLMGGLFPMPRIVYAMAQDGLIFRFLANINKRFKTPLIATLISGILAAIMVLIFDLEDLVDMMSIGTLLAYSLVAICVLILRYQPETTEGRNCLEDNDDLWKEDNRGWCQRVLFARNKLPTFESGNLVYSCSMIIGVLSFILCSMLVHSGSLPREVVTVVSAVSGFLILVVTVIIIRQPQAQTKLSFQVPFVPILPILSTICNIYLMCELSLGTWIRFSIWMAIGFAIYGFYGYKNSEEGKKLRLSKTNESTANPHKQSLI